MTVVCGRRCRWWGRPFGGGPFRMPEQPAPFVATLHTVWHDRSMNATMPSTAIRRSLADILLRIHEGAVIEITHYDRPAAVMVPPGWYKRAAEALAAAEQGE